MKETLFFDYDGTLVKLWPLKDRFKMALDSLGVKYDEATFEAAYRDFEEYLKINKYNFDCEPNFKVYSDLWYGAADKAAERLSLGEKERLHKKLDEIASSDKPFPETREVIESLYDKGYNLSVITNNFWDIGKKLDNLRLSPYFDSVVSHFEAKAMKPDRKIFELALMKAKARPDDSIM
ncbi:MAG: HAD family hydrolase, partial [Nanoarchaeota archaeon]|nr:HAD family hydrolase [Nanoarchaeota archaeon]